MSALKNIAVRVKRECLRKDKEALFRQLGLRCKRSRDNIQKRQDGYQPAAAEKEHIKPIEYPPRFCVMDRFRTGHPFHLHLLKQTVLVKLFRDIIGAEYQNDSDNRFKKPDCRTVAVCALRNSDNIDIRVKNFSHAPV